MTTLQTPQLRLNSGDFPKSRRASCPRDENEMRIQHFVRDTKNWRKEFRANAEHIFESNQFESQNVVRYLLGSTVAKTGAFLFASHLVLPVLFAAIHRPLASLIFSRHK